MKVRSTLHVVSWHLYHASLSVQTVVSLSACGCLFNVGAPNHRLTDRIAPEAAADLAGQRVLDYAASRAEESSLIEQRTAAEADGLVILR
ncbi:hypothetical protein BDW68DRAFT_171355 [Aspergillus falconensis]